MGRALLGAAASAVMLAGCTAAPAPGRTPTASWSPGPCLGDVGYPDLPVWELNESLPVDGVAIEYVQSELAVHRGPGVCSAPRVRPVAGACPVQTTRSEETIGIMLGYTPDDLTVSEFSRGATDAITETVTGHAANDGVFQYRMTAWRYTSEAAAEESQITDIVGACDGATWSGSDVAVYEGDEPHRLAYRSGTVVHLIESIRNIAPDGSLARIDDTGSGLLPAEAIATIREWWTAQVHGYYGQGAVA